MNYYRKHLEDHLQLFAVCLMQKRDYLRLSLVRLSICVFFNVHILSYPPLSQPLVSIISYYT